jgi:plastocyanin
MKNQNILIVAGLVVLAIMGYVLYQNTNSGTNSPLATSTTNITEETVNLDSEINTGDVEGDQQLVENPDLIKENPDGIHIMADGKVMSGDGKEVSGASIRADGKIQLRDGTIITPAFDMRSSTDPKPTEATLKQSEHVVIDVAGVDFEYDIKQINVKEGDTVTINFKSNEGFHDWVVDEFNVATERLTEKDAVTSVTFVADTVGTFQYYCSVMTHRQMGMVGYLTVEER